jgi:hypothetical protein
MKINLGFNPYSLNVFYINKFSYYTDYLKIYLMMLSLEKILNTF